MTDPRKRELVLRWVRDLGLEGHAGFTAEGLTDNLFAYLYRNGAGVYIAKVRDGVEALKSAPVNAYAEIDKSMSHGEPSPSWFDDAALGPDVVTARKI